MALAEAGADYEFHLVSLRDERTIGAGIPGAQPDGESPGAANCRKARFSTESAAILLHLAERFPDAGLLPPPASFARADALRWLAFMASEIYPMVEIEDYPDRFAPKGAEAEALKARAVARIRESMLLIEKAVAGPWLLADGFSIADIYAAMFSRWIPGDDWRAENLPKINAMIGALSKRPRSGAVWLKHFG